MISWTPWSIYPPPNNNNVRLDSTWNETEKKAFEVNMDGWNDNGCIGDFCESGDTEFMCLGGSSWCAAAAAPTTAAPTTTASRSGGGIRELPSPRHLRPLARIPIEGHRPLCLLERDNALVLQWRDGSILFGV